MFRAIRRPNKSMLMLFVSLITLVLVGVLPAAAASPPLPPRGKAPTTATAKGASPYAGQVLILCGTLFVDDTCADAATQPDFNEAVAAKSLGLQVAVLTDQQWAALTPQDFASARGVILGDPACSTGPDVLNAAVDNASIWGPATTGNVIILGTDSIFHSLGGVPGAQQITMDGIKLAMSTPGFPGAYIALSCYYVESPPSSPVDVLNKAFDPAGNRFTVDGVSNDIVTVIGSNPFLTADTSDSLSCWGNSSHAVFDTFAPSFTVYATVLDPSSCDTAKPHKAEPIKRAKPASKQSTTPTEMPYILLRTSLAVGSWTPPPGWIMGDVRDAITGAVVPGGTLTLTDTRIPSYFSFNGGFLFSGLSIASGYGGSSTYGLHLAPPRGYTVVGSDTQKVSVMSGHFVWSTFHVQWIPVWVQVLRPNAILWSGPDSSAKQLGTIAQWSYLEVIDPMNGSRLYVHNPVTKGNAYIDRADVGPSGAPPGQ